MVDQLTRHDAKPLLEMFAQNAGLQMGSILLPSLKKMERFSPWEGGWAGILVWEEHCRSLIAPEDAWITAWSPACGPVGRVVGIVLEWTLWFQWEWKREDVTSGPKPGQLLKGFNTRASLCSHFILKNHKVGGQARFYRSLHGSHQVVRSNDPLF